MPLDVNDDLVQFELSTDLFIVAKNSLAESKDADIGQQIPSLSPLKATISIPILNIYEKINHYRMFISYK